MDQDDLYFSKSTDGGRTYAANIPVAVTSNMSGGANDIEVFEDGTISVVWGEVGQATGIMHLFSSGSVDAGTSWSSPRVIDGHRWDESCDGAEIALSHYDTTLFAAWSQSVSDPLGPGVFLARSTDRGITWASPARIDDSAPDNYTSIGLAVDEAGILYVAWVNQTSPEIRLQRSMDSGLSFEPSVRVSDPGWLSWDMSVAARHPGEVYVAWRNMRSLLDYRGNVYISKSADGGLAFFPKVKVDSSPINLTHGMQTSVAIDARDYVYVAWAGDRDEPSGPYDIFFARSIDGGKTFEPEGRVVDTTIPDGISQGDPDVAINRSGSAVVIWSDSRDDPSLSWGGDIYSAVPIYVADFYLNEPDISWSPASPTIGDFVTLNATVHNIGGKAASTIVRFYEGSQPPSQIGVDQPTGRIEPRSHSNVSVPWTATQVGPHRICVFADPDNTTAESNETNNAVCVSVLVQSLPVTKPDYVPFLPLPQSPIKAGLSKPVSLSIVVHNQGNATTSNDSSVAFYDEPTPGMPFAEFKVSPLLPGSNSSRFTAIWTSPAVPGIYLVSADVDHENNVTEWDETNNVYTWAIEVVAGPVTSLVIGNPNHAFTATYIKSTTPLDLSVLDQSGLGIRNTTYRIDGGSPINYTATGTFSLAGEGVHEIEWWSLDWAGNLEDVNSKELTVDDTPPATAISIGEPKYTTGGTYVNSTTPMTLTVNDAGVGPNSTFFRLWDGTWTSWQGYSTPFTLAGRDGTWYVEFLSYDYLGNVESVRNQTIILDDTPPVTSTLPATGPYTTATVFTLTANDARCGVNITRYRIDGGSWISYSGGFTLPEGEHNVSYYSNDMLNNTERERWLVVDVGGTQPPPVEVTVNYKPVVAVMFAIILLVAGIWSSRRRPWKGGKGRMAVVKAFVIFSLPFVLLEATTGLISLLTGSLAVPPLVGIGTGVDSGILMVGLAIAVPRMRVKSPASE